MSPFDLMNTLFIGMLLSLAYGALSVLIVYAIEDRSSAAEFVKAYLATFNTAITFGLIIGTALIVYRSQSVIPEIIGAAFTADQPATTEYFKFRRRFESLGDSVTFMGEFGAVAFVVFAYCGFPLSPVGDAAMILAACAQWALGVYVGRKLCYAGMMLHSLTTIKVERNLFEHRELDGINTYVNIVSTLTIIFVYVHVRAYLNGPFEYHSAVGESIKLFLVLPAIIATPVLLIFNFYPRLVLRRIYGESINIAIKELQATLQDEGASHLEKRSHLIAFDKMSRDELRYSMQLTLSDLPIGITILIMIIEPLVKR
jgi:hypothetical protein